MKKSCVAVLDLDEFNMLAPVNHNKYTELVIRQKNISPSQKYLFKTFKFNCNTQKEQKIVLNTFYKLNSHKCQYLQCYKRFSFISFQSEFHPTFQMKYIQSTTLDQAIKDPNFKDNWTICDAMKCLFAVAKALSFLHNHIIYHGNLCPSNIIIDNAKQCYVCDFGLYPIKKLYVDQDNLCNHDYKDPNMGIKEPKMINDIYSFGVLMCQFCLIFFMPESKETLHEFVSRLDLEKINCFPPIFSDLIPKCLNNSFDKRPFFNQILDFFQDTKYVTNELNVNELYNDFIKSNYIVSLANLGDSFALTKLGEMYEKGEVFPKNRQKALFYFEKAALAENSEAEAKYGILLQEEGNGNDENKIKGAHFLELSAQKGNIHGMANFGLALKEGEGVKQNIEEAEKYLKRSADLGYAIAQTNYGNMLLEVNPSLERINEGLKYIKMAMNQGNPYAYYTYGVLLQNGNYVAKDESIAMNYFKIAADMGYEKAIVKYANGNEKGTGIPKNKEIALKYYQMAYEKGVDQVKANIELLSKPKKRRKRKSKASSQPNSSKTEITTTTEKLKAKKSDVVDLSSVISSVKHENEKDKLPVVKAQSLSQSITSSAVKNSLNNSSSAASSQEKQQKVIFVSSSSSDVEEIENEHPKIVPVFTSSSSTEHSPNIHLLVSNSSSTQSSSNMQSPDLNVIVISSSSTQSSSNLQSPNINTIIQPLSPKINSGNAVTTMQSPTLISNLSASITTKSPTNSSTSDSTSTKLSNPNYEKDNQKLSHSLSSIAKNKEEVSKSKQQESDNPLSLIISSKLPSKTSKSSTDNQPSKESKLPAEDQPLKASDASKQAQTSLISDTISSKPPISSQSSLPKPQKSLINALVSAAISSKPPISSQSSLPKPPINTQASFPPKAAVPNLPISNQNMHLLKEAAQKLMSSYNAPKGKIELVTNQPVLTQSKPQRNEQKEQTTSAPKQPITKQSSTKTNQEQKAAGNPAQSIVSVPSSSSEQHSQNSQSSASITKASQNNTEPNARKAIPASIISVMPSRNAQKPANQMMQSAANSMRNTASQQPIITNTQKTVSVPPPKPEDLPFNENTSPYELLVIYKKFKKEFRNASGSGNVSRSQFPLYKYEDKFISTGNPDIIYKYGRLYDNDTNTKAHKSKAMKYYKMAADQGNAKAQCLYGVALQNGKEVKKNLKEGFKYLEMSANQGDLNGMSNYGLALFNGDGTKKKKDLGLEFLKKAADKGDPFAQLNYGLCAKDPRVGHQYIEKAVSANYKKAFFHCATNLMDGHGVDQDVKRASEILLFLYEMEKKNKVLINLIECLKLLDYNQSLKYMKILADLDDKNIITYINKARFQYGLELFYGNHIEKNVKEAIKYLSNSGHLATIKAKYGDIYAQMPHDFSSVKDNVNAFLKRNGQINPQEERIINSAYNGDPNDTLQAGKLIEKAGDFRTANFFYEIAADCNQSEAAFIIGKYYLEGKNGLAVNQTKGNKYINKSSELGYNGARFEIIKYQLKSNKNSSKESELISELMPELTELAAEKYVPAIIMKAKLLANDNSWDEAKLELQKALQLAPNDQKVMYKVGRTLLRISKDDEIGYRLIENSSQGELKACYFLGKYYLENKDKAPENLEKAESYLIKAAESKIKDSQRLLNACKMELDQKRREQLSKMPVFNPIQDPELLASQNDSQADVYEPPKPQKKKPGPKPKQKSAQKQKPEQKQKDQESKQDEKQEQAPNQDQEQNQQTEENKDSESILSEDYINLDLPTEELLKKGDLFREKGLPEDAFQCFEEAAKRGCAVAYFKCAQVYDGFETKLQYYENAIHNKVPGALSEWRACIFGKISHFSLDKKHKALVEFAERFEQYNDFSDAAIVYKKAKENLKFESCYEKAKENIQSIEDGNQLFDFAHLLEKQNETELAITVFKKAAECGIEKAAKKIKDLSKVKMNQLKSLSQVDSLLEQGICYFEGKNGATINLNKALECFKKASDIGCPKADFYIGCLYKKCFGGNQANLVNSANFFKKAADAGDSDGQNGYGSCLEHGLGVQQSLEGALRYYKLSADQGSSEGEFNYGRAMYTKSSNDEDKNVAIFYLKKSAEKMYPDGLYLYSRAILQTDPEEAEKLRELSIDKGSELAIKEYGKELKSEEKMSQAAELYKKAADKGLLIGYRKYAKLMINEDDEVARDYFKKAAEFGGAKDQFNYAEFLFQYFPDEPAEERAKYYKNAAEQNYVKAFFRYAFCLSSGEGVQKNVEEARKYYTLSYKKDPKSPALFILPKLKEQNLIDLI